VAKKVKEEKEEKPRGLFDVLNSLSKTKEMKDGDLGIYDCFMANKYFSKFPDTIFLSNEMNSFPDMDKETQMDFYLSATVPRARFAKWFKPPPSEEMISFIIKSLKVSKREALSYLELLSPEERENILPSKGGLVSSKTKSTK
jgi:hypothetical protein